MRDRLPIGCVIAFVLAAACAAGAEGLRPVSLEDYGSTAFYRPDAVSSDGRIVAGVVKPQFSATRFVRWVDGALETLMTTQSFYTDAPLHAMTPDGAAVVGRRYAGATDHGFIWRDGVTTFLEPVPPFDYSWWTDAWDVSPDGRRVVGWSRFPYSYSKRWPLTWLDGAVAALPLPAEYLHGEARFLSEDGSRIVGFGNLASGTRLLVWENGGVHAIEPASADYVQVEPLAMSSEGGHVVGTATLPGVARAFHWDGESFLDLGHLPGGQDSRATGVSRNGEVIVGRATTRAAVCSENCTTFQAPFIWTAPTGMRPLKEYLQYACGYDLNGWGVGQAAISDNGRFLAFPGNDPQGLVSVFVVEIGDFCDPDYEVPENPIAPGDFLVTNTLHGNVARIDRETGEQAYVTEGGSVGSPHFVVQGPANELFVVQYSNIVGVDVHSGAQRHVAGLASRPDSLAIDREGRLFAAERIRTTYPPTTRIVRIDPATGSKTPVAEGALLDPGSGALVIDRQGKLFYRNANQTIVRIDPDTGEMSPVVTGDLGNQDSMSLTRDTHAVLGDDAGLKIIDLATGSRRVLVPDRTSVGLPFVDALATSIDSLGRLLVPNHYLHRLDAVHLDSGAIDRIVIYGLLSQPSHAIEWRARCDDGFDNDGDGWWDYPDDPGCRDAADDDETHVTIGIDIVPGSPHNVLPRVGPIPVAVLGSASFDVRSLDVSSVRFGPGGAQPLFNGTGVRLDVNGDGYRDWTLLFRSEEAAIPDTAAEACLSADDDTGAALHGCDAVQAPPLCELGPSLAFLLLPLWRYRPR